MNREDMIAQICEPDQKWDFIIIGGGATGVGSAIDGASRGYKTLLLEQNDFGKGTSSRSTKLVHGGVRYLQQGNILSKEKTLERIPTIETNGLKGGIIYHDGQFDDSRLVINMAQTAFEQGATLLNYLKVVDYIKKDNLITREFTWPKK